ncbi:hypothetical protein L2E82_01663 [Cichorium intybus]|uniref:Uncharacterized protein n=1 Tax=Cichorium intybus TaxID=13427 RepID=A0ACB9GZY7_CICIN|nr:hypothetical protein L2E82_01663 [Cichorium intybus]
MIKWSRATSKWTLLVRRHLSFKKQRMDEYNSERSKAWNMYTDSPHSPPQTGGDGEGPWKNFGTSMNAISFGFVATAVLISMFLIMAIFEHLFRPNASFPLPQHGTGHSPEDSRPMQKLASPQSRVQAAYASDFSVLMPGQQYPTYIAHSAPLPCSREGARWPSHQQQNYVFP